MFTSEQAQHAKVNNQTRNTLLTIGMTLVKLNTMNQKFTHKELILVLGVAVALLVVFLLWFTQVPIVQSSSPEKSNVIPHVISPTSNDFWKKAFVEFSSILIKE